jgi:enamine deaminase RidA (YjgF/YER057c/UK114 family)
VSVLLVEPEGWPRPSGYADGALARGRVLAVAGQVGWDPLTRRIETEDLAAQALQALRNVAAVLGAAGAKPSHVVRLTWYVTDREAYLEGRKAIGRAYREVFGSHYPAMAVVVVSGLVEPRARVEIEATAVLPE